MTTASLWNPGTTDVPSQNSNSSFLKQQFTATAGQTLFTLTSFVYVLGTNSLLVFDNGVMLVQGVDFTETSTSSFTLAAGATLNHKITAYGLVEVSAVVNTPGAGTVTTASLASTLLVPISLGGTGQTTAAAALAALGGVGVTGDNAWTGNQTFVDNKFQINDNVDATKVLNFQLSAIATATTRTYTWPDKSGTVAMLSDVASNGFQLLTASIAANALTATLANGSIIQFNDGTSATLTSQITVTASSGSTLGTVSAQASRIWVVALKNSGTPELALYNTLNGTDISFPALRSTISTTAEGGAGAADSAQVFYSTTARSNQAWAIIGYIDSTQTTAGTWAQALTLTQGFGQGIPIPGSIVQVKTGTNATRQSVTAVIPSDDTVPQVSEGTQVVSAALTAISASNLVLAAFDGTLGGGTGATYSGVALFQDATANALASRSIVALDTTDQRPVYFEHPFVINTASASTLQVRAGVTGGTLYTNGSSAGRLFGGNQVCRLKLTEIQV